MNLSDRRGEHLPLGPPDLEVGQLYAKNKISVEKGQSLKLGHAMRDRLYFYSVLVDVLPFVVRG